MLEEPEQLAHPSWDAFEAAQTMADNELPPIPCRQPHDFKPVAESTASDTASTLFPEDEWYDASVDDTVADSPAAAAHFPLQLLGDRQDAPLLDWYSVLVSVATLALATLKLAATCMNKDAKGVAVVDWVMSAILGLLLFWVDRLRGKVRCLAWLCQRDAIEDLRLCSHSVIEIITRSHKRQKASANLSSAHNMPGPDIRRYSGPPLPPWSKYELNFAEPSTTPASAYEEQEQVSSCASLLASRLHPLPAARHSASTICDVDVTDLPTFISFPESPELHLAPYDVETS
ncbi:hypothetical protein PsYK624_061770 [Phanerochaete sordida]|uniref:Uncharacterized protein n=1 Tax=Phanerochaete sordida TaxID=48140 RepID=A0A9P3LCY7_9APHY|nr:hypothetical protein PsYK624_061770 [Phanerochaete sordida]